MTFELGCGTVLGRYELLAPVAKGGMAQVWMARLHGSRGFHKLVAVKTILTKASHELRSEAMLLEEARLAALIHHPNIVTTLDLGEERGLLYLVMEWVHGETLRDVFQRSLGTGGIPPNLAVNIIAQACKGLHAAHEATSSSGLPLHLVHRDISPQNVLLAYSGVVKVADFGIAKAKVTTAELTQPGELKGKVAYMSPEQLACEALDRRADVFAMGSLLYTITTGHHPFRGTTTAKTYDNIIACNPPRPSAITRQYPPDLERVVLKALAADRTQRFQTAAEMFSALVETQLGSQGHFESAVAGYLQKIMSDKERERAALLQRCQSASPTSLRPSTPPPSPDRITLPTIVPDQPTRPSQPPAAESLSPAVLRAAETASEDGPSTSTSISLIRGPHRRLWLGALALSAVTLGVAFAQMLAPDALRRASNDSVRVAVQSANLEAIRDQAVSAALPVPKSELANPQAVAATREVAKPDIPSAHVQDSSAPLDAKVARIHVSREARPTTRQPRTLSPVASAVATSTVTAPQLNAWDRQQFGGRN